MAYFLIRHRYDPKQLYRAEASSKTSLRNQLPRYDESCGRYHSFWDLEEISFAAFRANDTLGPPPYKA